MQKEDFELINSGKLSEVIFQGSKKQKKRCDNMYIPMSGAMFKEFSKS